MRKLTLNEIGAVSGGDGSFKIVINADVSADCKTFIVDTIEKLLCKEITEAQADALIFSSSFTTHEIEQAYLGLDVIFWH